MDHKVQKKKQGFTLLELLLVIAIIAVLAGIITFALRPAENLQNAEDVRAMSNAVDIKKALELYALDHEGQYPTALQAEFNSGLTRVDICVSGETCEGVDLTTPLVTEGYLSTIPIHTTYGSTTDSGYDIYSSGGSIGVIESPRFLLRDDFTTAESAPLTSPRTAEPGPGTWTVYDPLNNISISNGNIINPNNNSLNSIGLSYGPTVRKSGRTIIARRSLNNVQIAWRNSSAPGSLASTSAFTGQMYRSDINDSGQYISSPNGFLNPTGSILAIAQRSDSFFFLFNNEDTWTLRYVGRPYTAPTLYGHLTFTYSGSGNTDWVRIVDLPSPFDSDFGLATQNLEGLVSNGQTFKHEKDAIIEWIQSSLPVSGNTELSFRKQDNNNFWQVLIGNSGTITLYEVSNGSPVQRASAANIVSSGNRIVIILSGNRITAFSNGVERWSYGNASVFNSNKEGEVETLGSGGNVSNLVTWPRFLSGEAADVLNNAIL